MIVISISIVGGVWLRGRGLVPIPTNIKFVPAQEPIGNELDSKHYSFQILLLKNEI